MFPLKKLNLRIFWLRFKTKLYQIKSVTPNYESRFFVLYDIEG